MSKDVEPDLAMPDQIAWMQARCLPITPVCIDAVRLAFAAGRQAAPFDTRDSVDEAMMDMLIGWPPDTRATESSDPQERRRERASRVCAYIRKVQAALQPERGRREVGEHLGYKIALKIIEDWPIDGREFSRERWLADLINAQCADSATLEAALREVRDLVSGIPGPEWGADEGLEKYRNWIGWCNAEMIKAEVICDAVLTPTSGAADGKGEEG